METQLPIVAIIGRPNVGKSSLFNRLIGQPKAIVAREAGTTRDRVEGILQWQNRHAWLVDTAGVMTIGQRPEAEASLHADVQGQIDQAKAIAATIVVVIDAGVPVSQLDKDVAKSALKTGHPVILAVNKLDQSKGNIPDEVKKLGIKTIVGTSAAHRQGIDELADAIFAAIPKAHSKSIETPPTLAIVGRPNVGKSSLFNALSGEAKALVSDIAGTTRDLNQATIKTKHGDLQILDTGGIRRPGKRLGLEHFSYLRTLWAINQADVAALVMDATEPSVALEQTIAGAVRESGKGLILLINKWDLIEDPEGTQLYIENLLKRDFAFVPWAPVVLTSAASKRNLQKITELTAMILKNRRLEVKTSQLNEFLQKAMAHHPPAGLKGRQPKIKYVTQTGTNPPQFSFFGHNLSFLHWSYKRYLESQLRDTLELTGTPIKFRFKDDKEAK